MAFNLETNGLLPSAAGMKSISQVIELKAVTWCKDSHGLFDYESKALDIKKFHVEQSSTIHRQGEDILIVPKASSSSVGSPRSRPKILAITNKPTDRERYFIDPTEIVAEENKGNDVFLIVRSLKNSEGVQRGFTLQPGHIMKLGRMEFRVLECGLRNGQVTKVETDLDREREFRTVPQSSGTPAHLDDTRPICRICLIDEEEDNVLIAPCKCRGSCEYMHLACFQHWFRSKISEKEYNNAWNFHWKKLECEVCQESIPRLFRIQGQKNELFDLKRPVNTPYLILETVTKEKKAGRGIHVLKVNEEGVKLGRGHQCDVRIGDISVSRLHAEIKYQNDSFVLTDNNSKFGTLVLLQEAYPIREEKVAVQIGRTVITFVQKPKSQLFKQKSTKPVQPSILGEKNAVKAPVGLQRAHSEAFQPNGQFNMIDLENMSPSQGMIIESENMRISEVMRPDERMNMESNLIEEEVNVVGISANYPLQFPIQQNVFQAPWMQQNETAAQFVRYNLNSWLTPNQYYMASQMHPSFLGAGFGNTFYTTPNSGANTTTNNKGPFNS